VVLNHQTGLTRVKAREREETVTQLRAEGNTFEEIGRRLGIRRQTATTIWERAVSRVPVANINQVRADQVALIDTATRELFVIARDTKAANKDRVEAWNSLCKWAERRSKLLGLDSPARKEINVLSADTVKDATRRLQAELTLRARAAGIELSALPAYAEVLDVFPNEDVEDE
jgi:DNA-binding CsgD family transcriptional regulator